MKYYYDDRGNLSQVRRRRLASLAVDLLIMYTLSAILVLMLLFASYIFSEADFNFTVRLFSSKTRDITIRFTFIFYIIYLIYFFSKTTQATIGMRIFSLKIQPFDGVNPSLGYPFSYMPTVASCIVVILPFYLSFIISRYKRSPHDYFLKIIFVRSDTSE